LGNLKKLAGQTALYGLSSILGKTINFILTPIHTAFLTEAAFGRNVDFYSLIGFLIVLVTYGFETAFFRFSEKPGMNKERVYSTATWSLIITSSVFLLLALLFQDQWAQLLLWDDRPEFVTLLALILVMDALAAIPFARLRAQNRALRFVTIKLSLIGATFLMNLVFFYGFPAIVSNGWLGANWVANFYNGVVDVHFIFYANLIGSGVMLLLLAPEFKALQVVFDVQIWRQMLRFGVPLMIGGFAGIANELLDRQLLKYLPTPDGSDPFIQIGIYGAVYKLSIFLVLFNQAFRYAAEPFFFAQGRTDNRATLATVLRYFTIVLCVGFVGVICGIDVLKFFIDEKFHSGLYILPILLLANVFLGVNTHLSIWYKLSDRTGFGIVVTGIGLFFTLVFNLWLIPLLGYEGAAWATLVSYVAMTVVSYLLGQRYYYIPYAMGRMLLHILLAVIFSLVAFNLLPEGLPLRMGVFAVYLLIVTALEYKSLTPYLKRQKPSHGS
jgi:O-antigen/teichoic acid export membrane protein